MNRTQKLLVFVLLIGLVAAMAFTMTEIAPNLVASVGWHGASVGWHGDSVGWHGFLMGSAML
jgi:hypothetical protein